MCDDVQADCRTVESRLEPDGEPRHSRHSFGMRRYEVDHRTVAPSMVSVWLSFRPAPGTPLSLHSFAT